MGLLSVIGCWKIKDDTTSVKRMVDPAKRKEITQRELMAIAKVKVEDRMDHVCQTRPLSPIKHTVKNPLLESKQTFNYNLKIKDSPKQCQSFY